MEGDRKIAFLVGARRGHGGRGSCRTESGPALPPGVVESRRGAARPFQRAPPFVRRVTEVSSPLTAQRTIRGNSSISTKVTRSDRWSRIARPTTSPRTRFARKQRRRRSWEDPPLGRRFWHDLSTGHPGVRHGHYR
jgi:hypothetical protein